jgi:hypothetical protein
MANQTYLPEISHYITSYDPEGKSTFLAAPNPPLVQQSNPLLRVDYVYSTLSSATGPVLKDLVDYKNNEDVRRTPPYVMFPLAGGSAAVVACVSFHVILRFTSISFLQLCVPSL